MGCLIDRTGEEKIMKNGQKAKIIVYRTCNDIDIEFEDGTIVEYTYYSCFKQGEIANPNYKPRLGEEKLMKNGQKAKIIVYNSCHDITVAFEDGTLVEHRYYSSFKKGCITNPNYNPNSKLGEEIVMNNGQKAKIVAYRDYKDIDIEFEDGTIVKNKDYSAFKKGEIKNPNYNPNRNLGEERVMNNGQKAKIIVYNGFNDIIVEFEDGTVVRDRTYANFKNGLIRNPNLVKGGKIGSFRIIKKILTKRDEETKEVRFVLWQCQCEKCGYESLISPQMMLKHTC